MIDIGMDRRDFMKIAGASVLAPAVLPIGCGDGADPASRPNIVLIMADDLGYECIGANGGGSYQTPVLDQLAAGGMRFEHCYAMPACAPTRMQLMTGQYNCRNFTRIKNGFAMLAPHERTFANDLRDAGYATFMAGKWQMATGLSYGGPQHFGFDEYCLWLLTRPPQNAERYVNPNLEINGKQVDFTGGEYGPDIAAASVCDFIRRKKSQPFFAYYSMMLPHFPFGPTPDHPDWDPHAPRPTDRGDPKYFPAMVAYMDKLVGRIIAQLDALGLRENTLVLFTADNGTYWDITSQLGDRSVTGGKMETTDAGTHVPLIANWPGVVPRGHVTDTLVDFTDFTPTLSDLGGAMIHPDRVVDGRSFMPQLRGDPGDPRDWIYCWYNRAGDETEEITQVFARNQRYKLYQTGKFYDVANDPLEKRPLNTRALDPRAAAVHEMLKGALAKYQNARPPNL